MSITAEEAASAGLSKAEIDAINGVEASDPEHDEILGEIAGDPDDDPDTGGDDGAGGDDDQGSDTAGDDGAAAAGDSGAGDDQSADAAAVAAADDLFAVDPADLPAVNFVPQLTGELLPEFVDAETAAYITADTKRAEFEAKFEAGDIDEAQLKAEQRRVEQELNAEIRKINAANTNAELEKQRWEAEQAAFFDKYGQYAATPILYSALNAEVVRLANLPESAGKTGLQVLMAAKKSVDTQLRAVTGAPAAEVRSPSSQPTPPKPKATMPDVKTLAGVPSAAPADVGKGRFSHLDNLTGLELEAAIARLSETDRAAYLAEN